MRIREQLDGAPCDVLVALHARKSAAVVQRFARRQPATPIVVALTGTDLYRDIHRSAAAQRSLERAWRLVLLQGDGRRELPDRLQDKVRVIHQSTRPPGEHRPRPLRRVFEICVSGHLRPVKDPFRAAMAARRLPAESRIAITHLGAALSGGARRRAEAEMLRNPRYRWLGDCPYWKARRLLSRSRLLVLSSTMEGGANVLVEALAADVPILSSRISGSIGLLGEDYPGYFPPKDTDELARLLRRCECDPPFYRSLKRHCRRRSVLVAPERERDAWRDLVEELLPPGNR